MSSLSLTAVVVLVLFLGITPINASEPVFNILDYGAKPGLNHLCTDSIQAAIDACHEQGGGVVLFPKGRYVTGTLFLKSGVHLKFEDGAKLFGSTSLADYAEVPVATEEPHFSKCLFYANGVEDVSITGQDTAEINGRGYYFKFSPERPKLFRIENSSRIRFQDITIKNSGSWCVYFGACDDITITRVSVYNKENYNNDGMNFDACSNVTIRDCNLQVEDDAICLKSSIDRVCENITVEGCTVSSYHAALKFGTASAYGFRNVTVRNCRFYDCRYGTIKLLVVDGGYIDNVHISDIELFNCAGPIFIRLGNRGRSYDKSIRQVYGKDVKPEGRPVGSLRNVYIGRVRGRLYGRNDAVEGIMLTGIPGHYIENVTLEDIDFSYSGHGDLDVTDHVVPEDEARYPEQSFFGVLPSYALFARHVRNLKVNGFRATLRSPDDRRAIYCEDVVDSVFAHCRVDIGEGTDYVLDLKDSRGLVLDDLKVKGQAEHLVRLRGDCESVEIRDVDLKGYVTPAVYEDGAEKGALRLVAEDE